MITIVGGLPEPIGGVTTFVMRLALHLASQAGRAVEVLDLYPRERKIPVPVELRHTVAPSGRILKLVWLVRNLLGKSTVHFNFSTPTSLYLFLILPKWRSRWILTLHHGHLADYDSSLLRFLWPLLARRFDHIVALSTLQHRYYLERGIPADRLLSSGSYIRPHASPATPAEDVVNTLRELRAAYQTIVFASGSPTRAYRHRELIAAFNRAAAGRSACLLLCIYGEDSENLSKTIRQDACHATAKVHLVGALDEVSFNYLLQHCDIYVRANSVDSCGIALFDAMSFGVRVLASDVCRRPIGATLFQTGNYAELEEKLTAMLSIADDEQRQHSCVDDDLDFYKVLYHDTPRRAA